MTYKRYAVLAGTKSKFSAGYQYDDLRSAERKARSLRADYESVQIWAYHGADERFRAHYYRAGDMREPESFAHLFA